MSVLTIRHEEVVSSSPQQVWDFVAEQYFRNHQQWDPAVVGMSSLTPGAIRAGTVGEETRRFLGRQRARFEITTFEPVETMALRNTTGPFKLDRRYTLTADGRGTRLLFTFDMAPKGPAAVVFPFTRRTIERQVHANIARLGQLLRERG